MIEREKLIKIVGAGNVSYEKATLAEYSSDMSFVNAVKPVCVVRPANTTAIQKLVELANKTLTPLVPVSSGPPHFRGDTVPGIGGAVIVDLSGMRKIIRITRKNRVAMVEPGVTFGELIPAVEKEGLRLNMPLLPRKTKTVIGSMLEREPVLLPKYHWDISDPLACVEAVFGCGEIFRTGQAAGPGTIEEQWAAGGTQKTPYGPGPAAWYRLIQGSQGTMGIVTWASLRCELLPKLEEPFMVGSPELNKLLEMAHWLIRMRQVNECLILNSTNLAAVMANKWPGDYRNIKDTLPLWILFYNLAGYNYYPEDFVYKKKVLEQIIKETGGKSLKAVEDPAVAATLLFQCTRVSASIRETFRAGGMFSSMMVQGQRYDLHVRWLEQAAVWKRELIKKGLVVADDGQQFGWGEEQGHLGHTEIFCRYNPYDAEAFKAVHDWMDKIGRAAIKGHYAVPVNTAIPIEEIGAHVCNYHVWLGRLKKAFDPNLIGARTGFSYVGADTSGAHTSLYKK